MSIVGKMKVILKKTHTLNKTSIDNRYKNLEIRQDSMGKYQDFMKMETSSGNALTKKNRPNSL